MTIIVCRRGVERLMEIDREILPELLAELAENDVEYVLDGITGEVIA